MSNFPSIEEFDSGQVTATRLEDAGDGNGLLDTGESDFFAHEKAVLGEDAEFFQGPSGSFPPTQGETSFFGGGQGFLIFVICSLLMFR
jgi:Clathrin light chain